MQSNFAEHYKSFHPAQARRQPDGAPYHPEPPNSYQHSTPVYSVQQAAQQIFVPTHPHAPHPGQREDNMAPHRPLPHPYSRAAELERVWQPRLTHHPDSVDHPESYPQPHYQLPPLPHGPNYDHHPPPVYAAAPVPAPVPPTIAFVEAHKNKSTVELALACAYQQWKISLHQNELYKRECLAHAETKAALEEARKAIRGQALAFGKQELNVDVRELAALDPLARRRPRTPISPPHEPNSGTPEKVGKPEKVVLITVKKELEEGEVDEAAEELRERKRSKSSSGSERRAAALKRMSELLKE